MKNSIQAISFSTAFLLFLLPALALFIATHYLIGILNSAGIFPALSWFISGGFLVFIPLFIMAIILFGRENPHPDYKSFKERFRLKRMSGTDWLWSIGGSLLIISLTWLIIIGYKFISGNELDTTPSWLEFEVLKGSRLFILSAWAVFFFFNIIGEELMWRGYILPGQEQTHGSSAWLVNALLWTMFHISFGISLIILLLPILFILPYIVQKTKNTWTGVIIHAVVNGPSFILISLGVL